MKLTSLLRIKNEQDVILDSLNHLSEFSDEIFVYDDYSNDDTVSICEKHPNVKMVLRNYFDCEQAYGQTAQRNALLNYAKVHAKNAWILYADADERISFDFNKLEKYEKDGVNGIFLRLVDAYITPDSKDDYKQGDKLENLRQWYGIECREIGFIFKKDKARYDCEMPTQRQPNIIGKTIVDDSGYVLHFGKAQSIQEWDKTCIHYINNIPALAEKWKKRLGKAIHYGKSDFKTDLISKEDIIKRLKNNGNNLIQI